MPTVPLEPNQQAQCLREFQYAYLNNGTSWTKTSYLSE